MPRATLLIAFLTLTPFAHVTAQQSSPLERGVDLLTGGLADQVIDTALDPGGGALQEYVEDCHVCCRAWRVRVHYDAMGRADVLAEPTD